MGVSDLRSSSTPRAEEQSDAAGQSEAPRIGGSGIVFCSSAVALLGPRSTTVSWLVDVVDEGHHTHGDQHDPHDDERKCHGVSPLDCSLTLSGTISLPYGPWSRRLLSALTTPRIALSRSSSSNGLQRNAATPDFSACSRVTTSSWTVMKMIGMPTRSAANCA
jgi:hypothetical protein